MPSLNLSEDQISHVICLPGTALIRCLKPETETRSGLAIPEAAASWEQENRAIREGIIENMQRFSVNPESPKNCEDPDSLSLKCGDHVYYLGRQDERHDAYVVVKIGQIVAVKEPKNAQV